MSLKCAIAVKHNITARPTRVDACQLRSDATPNCPTHRTSNVATMSTINGAMSNSPSDSEPSSPHPHPSSSCEDRRIAELQEPPACRCCSASFQALSHASPPVCWVYINTPQFTSGWQAVGIAAPRSTNPTQQLSAFLDHPCPEPRPRCSVATLPPVARPITRRDIQRNKCPDRLPVTRERGSSDGLRVFQPRS